MDQIHVVVRQPERAQERRANGLRTIVVNLQPHGLALAAVAQFDFHRVEQAAQVALVKVKLAVARDAEAPPAEHGGAGEQVGEGMADQLAEQDIILPPVGARQADQARQHARQLDHGRVLQPLAVGGQLHVEAAPGSGSRLRFELPIRPEVAR